MRYAEQVLNDNSTISSDDQRLRTRIDYALDVLNKYSQALKPVRATIDLSQPDFANGM